MQTMESVAGVNKPSIFTVLRTSIEQSGIRSVYTGLTASWMRQARFMYTQIRVFLN
jgi:dicarboxylate transporter 10